MLQYPFMGREKFICNTELPYHITARCINRDWFSIDSDLVWEIMTTHLHFMQMAFEIRIHAFVLMSNHFHLIAVSPKGNLSAAMRFFMSESGRDLRRLSNRINLTYGSRFHRSLLSSPIYYLHAYKYLYRNPIEAGLCARVEDYKYSSLQGLLGKDRIWVPIFDDENWGDWNSRLVTLAWLNTKPPKDDWGLVRKGLKKGVFKISRLKNHLSHLEVNAL